MFTPSRDDARRFFFNTWHNHKIGIQLTDLERTALAILIMHPEYHQILDQPDRYLTYEWTAEDGQGNPFLHLGLHLALEEQRSIDQPPGIRQIYGQLAAQMNDEHLAQHACIEALAETIWHAQRNNVPLNNETYLEKLRSQIKSSL